MNRFLIFFAAFLMFFGLSFQSRVAAGVIKIGAINPLTGKLAKHGIEIDEGIQIAIDEFNEQNGNSGMVVELERRDDHSAPDVAMNQAEQLILKEKVVALIGGYVDSLVGPVSVVAKRNRVPYVASASLQSRLTQGKNPYFFRVSCMNGVTQPVIEFLLKWKNLRKVAILHASTPGASEFARTVEKKLKVSGVDVVVEEKARAGQPDFSPFLLKCKARGAEFIISAVFFADHLVLVRQMREMEIPVKGYIGPWGVAYESFIKEMKNMAEGLYGLTAWLPGFAYPGTEEESRRFVELYKKKFGRIPTSTSMHGYVSARVVLEAVRKAFEQGGVFSGPDLANFIRKTKLLTPMGSVEFDEKGDPRWYKQMVVQIRRGKIVPVHHEHSDAEN
ncbi:MAG: ABC transporter substrate-binding protein [Deltaproteobacteria bacterium]|nr:ABC transporter substrate-binding protein [Deltaproteobacteria bacterium]MBW2069401.1 ABC transporter substrate-binding protein [Deltaproteobacteria bacterium]